VHPETGQDLRFESRLPADIRRLVEKLRKPRSTPRAGGGRRGR